MSKKGYIMPAHLRLKRSLANRGKNAGSNNGQWKSNKVGYSALHEWIKNHLQKPQTCRDCNQEKPLDLANISGEYKREISDWEWLCRKCHMIKDGRLEQLKIDGGNYAKQFLKGQKQDKEFVKRRIAAKLKRS